MSLTPAPNTDRTTTTDDITREFLLTTFRTTGFMTLGRMVGKDRTTYRQSMFRYPEQMEYILHHISRFRETHNLYVCTTLSGTGKTRVDAPLPTTVVWADLDDCDPAELFTKPTYLIRTSPGRHQAWWVLNRPVEASEAVMYARNIAARHKDQGCDTHGGLGKLMRLPGTLNHNYPGSPPIVEVPDEQ
ncbi:DNA-primase RepB domain-containing protein [Dactylosporangium sp. NPDC005572]|uniref:DNA-primase RepB domain-containing protein n=1 Tax=Dactylosporangium sp. NPDC005572 TaxID=3156889 RepID=UPI0033B0C6B7